MNHRFLVNKGERCVVIKRKSDQGSTLKYTYILNKYYNVTLSEYSLLCLIICSQRQRPKKTIFIRLRKSIITSDLRIIYTMTLLRSHRKNITKVCQFPTVFIPSIALFRVKTHLIDQKTYFLYLLWISVFLSQNIGDIVKVNMKTAAFIPIHPILQTLHLDINTKLNITIHTASKGAQQFCFLSNIW